MKEIFANYGKVIIAITVGLMLIGMVMLGKDRMGSLLSNETILDKSGENVHFDAVKSAETPRIELSGNPVFAGDSTSFFEVFDVIAGQENLDAITVETVVDMEDNPVNVYDAENQEFAFEAAGAYTVYFTVHSVNGKADSAVAKVPVNMRLE